MSGPLPEEVTHLIGQDVVAHLGDGVYVVGRLVRTDTFGGAEMRTPAGIRYCWPLLGLEPRYDPPDPRTSSHD